MLWKTHKNYKFGTQLFTPLALTITCTTDVNIIFSTYSVTFNATNHISFSSDCQFYSIQTILTILSTKLWFWTYKKVIRRIFVNFSPLHVNSEINIYMFFNIRTLSDSKFISMEILMPAFQRLSKKGEILISLIYSTYHMYVRPWHEKIFGYFDNDKGYWYPLYNKNTLCKISRDKFGKTFVFTR